MDAFIKPVQGKSPDAAKLQTAYDTLLRDSRWTDPWMPVENQAGSRKR